VNGRDLGRVSFGEDGVVDGLSEFPGQTGFVVNDSGSGVEWKDVFGLYIWTDDSWTQAKHARRGSELSVVRSEIGAPLTLLREGVAVASASADRFGLPETWSIDVVTAPWKNVWKAKEPPFFKVLLDDSSVGFVQVSDDVLVSIGEEEEWYAAARPSRQFVLTRAAKHREMHLAAKYDLWGFQDKLGFASAKAYAVKAATGAARLLGRASAVLDLGSGAMAKGPFSERAVRLEIAAAWVAADVSLAHFQANCAFRDAGHGDVRPLKADIMAHPELAEGCDLVVAKDSLNNLPWPDLKRLLDALRSCGVRHILTNGRPGYDNSWRMGESLFDGDAWTYRSFDPAGPGLELELVTLFAADGADEHPGTWGLYVL
jgi:hypothetical protein